MANYVTSTVTAVAGQATYFLLTPQAEVAFWRTSVDTGTDWINGQDLVPTLFPMAATIFPMTALVAGGSVGGSNSSQVARGRCVSTAGELVPLNNAFTRGGSITVWKCPLSTYRDPGITEESTDTGAIRVNGIDGVRQQIIGSSAYTAAVRDGAYSTTMNREGEYNFHPVLDDEHKDSTHAAYFSSAATAPGIRARFNGPIATFDNNFDTIVMRIDVPLTAEDQVFLLKRWVNYEFEPVFNSLLYNTSHMSPAEDPVALTLYSEIARHLPIAVPYRDNPDFWDTVLKVVDEVSDVLSYLPGVGGTVAKGTHALTSALRKKGKQTSAPRKKAVQTKKSKPKPKRKKGKKGKR